jgi:hypothetical protein
LYDRYQQSLAAKAPEVVAQAPEPRPVESAEETECLACGKMIPAGAAKCEACGWTWADEGEQAGD